MNVGPNHMQTFVQQAKFKKLYPEDGKRSAPVTVAQSNFRKPFEELMR
jgi:hypothetical protein